MISLVVPITPKPLVALNCTVPSHSPTHSLMSNTARLLRHESQTPPHTLEDKPIFRHTSDKYDMLTLIPRLSSYSHLTEMASSGKRRKAGKNSQASKVQAHAKETRKQATGNPAKGKKNTEKKNGNTAMDSSSDGDERPTKKTRKYRTTVEEVDDIDRESAGNQGTSTSRARAKATQPIVVSSDDDDDIDEHEQSDEEEEDDEGDDEEEPAQDEDDEAELGECVGRHGHNEYSLW